LADAAYGHAISVTNDPLEVLHSEANGTVQHHTRDVEFLVSEGLLIAISPEQFVVTPAGRRAHISLPVKGR
jgi:hypothetical protein